MTEMQWRGIYIIQDILIWCGPKATKDKIYSSNWNAFEKIGVC